MTADIETIGKNTGGQEALAAMFQKASQKILSGKWVANKAVILFVDDREGQFSVRFAQAGLKMSQCVTVCEIAKTVFLKEMGY
jgi:hypothetical protein